MSDGMVSERAAGDMFISAIRAQAMAHDTYISDRLSLVATQEFSQEQKREIWDMQWNGIPSSKKGVRGVSRRGDIYISLPFFRSDPPDP